MYICFFFQDFFGDELEEVSLNNIENNEDVSNDTSFSYKCIIMLLNVCTNRNLSFIENIKHENC